MSEGWVTVAELSEITGVSAAVIRYHCRDGTLAAAAVKIGRDWFIPTDSAATFAKDYEPYGSLMGPRGSAPQDG